MRFQHSWCVYTHVCVLLLKGASPNGDWRLLGFQGSNYLTLLDVFLHSLIESLFFLFLSLSTFHPQVLVVLLRKEGITFMQEYHIQALYEEVNSRVHADVLDLGLDLDHQLPLVLDVHQLVLLIRGRLIPRVIIAVTHAQINLPIIILDVEIDVFLAKEAVIIRERRLLRRDDTLTMEEPNSWLL